MSYNSLTHHTVWFADHIMYHHRDGGSDKEKGVAKEIYGKKKGHGKREGKMLSIYIRKSEPQSSFNIVNNAYQNHNFFQARVKTSSNQSNTQHQAGKNKQKQVTRS